MVTKYHHTRKCPALMEVKGGRNLIEECDCDDCVYSLRVYFCLRFVGTQNSVQPTYS